MLLRKADIDIEQVIFMRSRLCQRDTMSLLQTSARAILNSVEITEKVIESLPSILILPLIKETLVCPYVHQLKNLLALSSLEYLNILEVAKSCCIKCYETFIENIEEKTELILETFFSALQERQVSLKEIDATCCIYNSCNPKLFSLIEQARQYHRGEKIKISISMKLHHGTSDVSNFDEAFTSLYKTLAGNEDSTVELVIWKFMFVCRESRGSADSAKPARLMKVIPKELEHLHVLNFEFYGQDLISFSKELKNLTNLITLDLEGDSIGETHTSSDLNEFGDSLAKLKKLENLDFSSNCLANGLESVVKPLENGLKVLDISNCEIQRLDMLYLAGSTHAHTLVALNLTENDFGTSFEALHYVLSELAPSIRLLYLENINVDHQDLVKCSEILSTSPSLLFVDFSVNMCNRREIFGMLLNMSHVKTLKQLVLEWPDDLIEEEVEHFSAKAVELLVKNDSTCTLQMTGRFGRIELLTTTSDSRSKYILTKQE